MSYVKKLIYILIHIKKKCKKIKNKSVFDNYCMYLMLTSILILFSKFLPD